jgi:hypothetical protein
MNKLKFRVPVRCKVCDAISFYYHEYKNFMFKNDYSECCNHIISDKSNMLHVHDSKTIPEQFINLYGNNGVGICRGKELYVGDIILFDNTDIGGSRVKAEIIYNDDQTLGPLGFALWVYENALSGLSGGFLNCDFLGDIEYLGNIHQNFELMKAD